MGIHHFYSTWLRSSNISSPQSQLQGGWCDLITEMYANCAVWHHWLRFIKLSKVTNSFERDRERGGNKERNHQRVFICSKNSFLSALYSIEHPQNASQNCLWALLSVRVYIVSFDFIFSSIMVWCTPIVLSLPTLKVWNFNKLGILKAWLHYLRSHAYLQRTTLKATSLEIVNKWIRWETDLLWQPWLPPQFCNLLK